MTEATAAAGRPSTARVISAGVIGNMLEWYDFAVYGYFAHIIGQQFFPSTDPAVSLIAAFGAFAAGFLVRPIGGLVFGAIGDLIGRRRALQLSILCMAVPTVLISVLPDYAQIGILAPILIVLLRILQGLSVGGEYTGSLVYLAEHGGERRRAFLASWGLVGSISGILLGSAVGALLTASLSEQAIADWGWRVPFAAGILVAITGTLLRRGLHETPMPAERATKLHQAFLSQGRTILVVGASNIGIGIGFYAAFVYSVTYVTSLSGLSEELAFDINTGTLGILLVATPLSAILSDRIGRRPMSIAGYLILALGGVPAFMLMHHADAQLVIVGQAIMAIGLGVVAGGMVGSNVELFPRSIRCTGLSFAYNTAIGIFGGTTPMICAALIAETGNPIAPGYWVAGAAALSLIFVLFQVRETAFKPLDDS